MVKNIGDPIILSESIWFREKSLNLKVNGSYSLCFLIGDLIPGSVNLTPLNHNFICEVSLIIFFLPTSQGCCEDQVK